MDAVEQRDHRRPERRSVTHFPPKYVPLTRWQYTKEWTTYKTDWSGWSDTFAWTDIVNVFGSYNGVIVHEKKHRTQQLDKYKSMKPAIVKKIAGIEAIVDTGKCPKSVKELDTYLKEVVADVDSATTEADAYTAELVYYKAQKAGGGTP